MNTRDSLGDHKAAIQAERLRERELQQKRATEQERRRDEWERFVDQFDGVPYVVRMGFHDRKSEFLPGDTRSFNMLWQSRGLHRHLAAMEMAEYLGQWLNRRSAKGRGPRNPQKQLRTWEAAAGKRLRWKRHCDDRWSHLFI